MRKTRLALLLFFVLYFVGCDFIYGLLHKEGAEEKKLVGELTPYEPNANVEEIQRLLEIYGYNPGKIDGILGLRTRNSIEKFQRDNNLNPTRVVDVQTWRKLVVFKKNGLIKDNRLNIPVVQELLNKAGFNPGTADGKFGSMTKKAVMEFQKAHNLKVDGKVGYKTLTQLSLFIDRDTLTKPSK